MSTEQLEQQIAAEIKAELTPTTEEKLAENRILLAENEKHGKQREVVTSAGEKKTVEQLTIETKAYLEEMIVKNIELQRGHGDTGSRPAEPENPVLDTPEKAAKLFGLKDWAELSPEHRATARSIRASDLDAVRLADYFGPGSSSKKANDLARSNPAMYKLLRERAVKDNLLGV